MAEMTTVYLAVFFFVLAVVTAVLVWSCTALSSHISGKQGE